MSYDLVFWKQKPACSAAPSAIYRELMNDAAVEGLEVIPIVEFLARVHKKFPGIVQDRGLVFWDGGRRGLFEIYSSAQHVHFSCRQVPGEDMNVLVDIGAEFGCPLYDPQVDKRYDSKVV
jgi:hypothetical protein